MTARNGTATELADLITAGAPAAIARGITWCEKGGDPAQQLLAKLPPRSAHVLGITGSPGSGKSTLVSSLVRAYRAADRAVAVVAVDPSSPITGGALLGDRARLDTPVGDRGLFFRSLASRGAAGGLADATWGAVRLLSAAGFDPVIVETVGAGQAEVSIMRVADTVALVLQPGSGDELQAQKAGLMEIADIYVLNKADQPGLLDLRNHVNGSIAVGRATDWVAPIIETVASRGTGAEELIAAVEEHGAHLRSGLGAQRTAAGSWSEAMRLARAAFERELRAARAEVVEDVAAGGETELGALLAERAARRLLVARAGHWQ